MQTQIYELNGKVIPFLVPISETGEWAAEGGAADRGLPKKDYRAPRLVRRAAVDRETVERLIESVRSL